MPNSFPIYYKVSLVSLDSTSFEIPETDIDPNMSDEELLQHIEWAVQQHFEKYVFPVILNSDDFRKWAHEMQAAQREANHA